jgi:hypothetical protein
MADTGQEAQATFLWVLPGVFLWEFVNGDRKAIQHQFRKNSSGEVVDDYEFYD